MGLSVLVVAAFFRLWLLEALPPGLQHDEIFNAEDALDLASQGNFQFLYPENYGREGAFIWLLAASYKLFGINLMMIKFPSLAVGLLTVALLFRFGCQNFSLLVGTCAGGLAAVSFWAVFASRVGLRAVLAPFIALLFLILIAQVFKAGTASARRRAIWLAGIAAGLAMYTYTSALALYATLAILVVIAVAFGRSKLRRHLPGLLAVSVIAAAIAMPMVISRLSHPAGLQRVSDTILPLYAAAQGDYSQLLHNAAKVIGAPAIVGDPTWRYNVAGRPLFLLPVGLLAYVGFGLACLGARKSSLNLVLVCLTAFGLLASLFTLEAPSFLRLNILMPCFMLFIGLAVARIGRLFGSSKAGWALALCVVLATGVADYHAYFIEWESTRKKELQFHAFREQGELVHTIYRDDLQQLADFLERGGEEVVAVSTPNKELDPLLFKYAGGEAKVETDVVFFYGQFNIALSHKPMLLFESLLSPISEKHAHWLTEEYGARRLKPLRRQDGQSAFRIYELSSQDNLLPAMLERAASESAYIKAGDAFAPIPYPVQFGDLLRIRGIEIPERTVYGENYGVHNQLYVEPLRSTDDSIQFFMHLLSRDGELVAQRDYLGVPAAHWHPAVLFMQDHFVPFVEPVPAGVYHLYLGLYDWRSGRRFPVVDENMQALADRLYLGEITVIDRPD